MRSVARVVLLIAYDQYDRNGGHVIESILDGIREKITDDHDDCFLAVEVEDEDAEFAVTPENVTSYGGYSEPTEYDVELPDDWHKRLVAPFVGNPPERFDPDDLDF